MNEETKEIGYIQDLEGRYTDAFRIGYSVYKFMLDFGQLASASEDTNFHTRVILSPDVAKIFIETFKQSLDEYEGRFGPIWSKF